MSGLLFNPNHDAPHKEWTRNGLTATEWWREWCVTWYTIGYGVAMEGFDVAKLRYMVAGGRHPSSRPSRKSSPTCGVLGVNRTSMKGSNDPGTERNPNQRNQRL